MTRRGSWAVILCGGNGTRMGAAGNKTLIKIGGVPAIVRACRAFEGVTEGTVLVARAGEEALFEKVLKEYQLKPYAIVHGGENRQESALCGLRALPETAEAALIHDGARPMVTREVILRVLDSIEKYGSGAAAVPARDTVKRADADGNVLETLDRAELWQMQTPQGFRVKELLDAHARVRAVCTDDAALMESAGYAVHLVQGDVNNLKLTSKEDVRMAESIAGAALPGLRVGNGFDAHRLVEGRALWLCGVNIPYEKGLLGHSDADAGLHALMDALLGAAGMPDIGHLFPDNDDRYLGISSLLLLKEVSARLTEAGFTPVNADITLVAQRPKLAPYIDSMRQAVADAMGTSRERVNIKASTTEHMGYEGRGEGITAYASVLLMHND